MAQARHQPHDPAARLRCERCGDVIGVYEPMVLVSLEGGWSLRTSLVATPDAAARGLAYHPDCHASAPRRVAGSDTQLDRRRDERRRSALSA